MKEPIRLLMIGAGDAGADDQERLTRARSMTEARELLTDGFEPDCVLVDLGLAGLAGTEAIAAVRHIDIDLPVVALTRADDPRTDDALRAGAHDHLPRDTDLGDEIAARTIRNAIDRAALVRQLRAARHELRDFAHRVAHDLKSPIAVIVGSLELLDSPRPDDEDADLRAMAMRSSRRLVDMVDRLREYADAASADETVTTVDLDAVVDWAVADLDPLLDGVELEREPLPRARGNEAALCHVFRNLIANAVRFRDPRRQPRIVIAAPAGDGATAVVTVTDNGVGIDPRHRASVFTPGYRVAAAESGSGLGLATVQRTMDLIGGSVRIEDGPGGVGTTFRLELSLPDGTGP